MGYRLCRESYKGVTMSRNKLFDIKILHKLIQLEDHNRRVSENTVKTTEGD